MSKTDELRAKLDAAKAARLADDGFIPQPKSQFSNGYSTREDMLLVRYREALQKISDSATADAICVRGEEQVREALLDAALIATEALK